MQRVNWLDIDPARSVVRKLFGLRRFSDEVEERTTGRTKLSMQVFADLGITGDVLNIGSSIGWFEKQLSERTDIHVVGLEHDAEKVSKARKNVPGADLVHGSVLAMPFADESFDAATMLEVLEHIPRNTEHQALLEVRRVLKKGARLFLSTPYKNFASCALDPAWYFGHRHYTREAVTSLFRATGFDVDWCAVRGGLWELLSMDLHYIYKAAFYAEVPRRSFWEERRSAEYAKEGQGISTIFITGTAV